MSDDFWEPIYAKLLAKHDYINEIAKDLPEKVIVELVLPNPELYRICKPYLKKKKIKDRPPFFRLLESYLPRDRALRKIILFTWIESNPESMKFPTLHLTEETEKKLFEGNFGSFDKIKILREIEPRQEGKNLLSKFLNERKQ